MSEGALVPLPGPQPLTVRSRFKRPWLTALRLLLFRGRARLEATFELRGDVAVRVVSLTVTVAPNRRDP